MRHFLRITSVLVILWTVLVGVSLLIGEHTPAYVLAYTSISENNLRETRTYVVDTERALSIRVLTEPKDAPQYAFITSVVGAETLLPPSETEGSNQQSSPDGTQIAFWSELTTEGETDTDDNHIAGIYVTDADGGATTLLVADADRENFGWSPDGRFFLSQHGISDDAGDFGRLSFRVTDLQTGDVRLTVNGAFPHWSPDGVHLAYASSLYRRAIPATTWSVANVETGKVIAVTEVGTRLRDVRWSADGRYLAYSMYTAQLDRAIQIRDMVTQETKEYVVPDTLEYRFAWRPCVVCA